MNSSKYFPHHYNNTYILEKNTGNNALSYKEREQILGKKPTLIIPSRITGNIDSVQKSENIVFEEVENGKIFSCKGLKNFVEIHEKNLPEIIVFDNHNHALFFWCEAIAKKIIEPGFELIHIDEHSDLWDNENRIENYEKIFDLDYIYHFTNFLCNVGNYIVPAMNIGLVKNIIRIENEFQIDEYMNYTPQKNSILNLDLDIFSPDLVHISDKKKMQCIKNLLSKVKYVTIATSPYFINQGTALQKLRQIINKEKDFPF